MSVKYIRPQSILEMTLFAEYLTTKGYLVTDLEKISPQLAETLIREACYYTQYRLNEILQERHYPWCERIQINLN